jgi:hypothetical protein
MDHSKLQSVDPNKLDFALDIRDLSREIVITIKVLDDATFKVLSKEAIDIRDEIRQEMAKYRP